MALIQLSGAPVFSGYHSEPLVSSGLGIPPFTEWLPAVGSPANLTMEPAQLFVGGGVRLARVTELDAAGYGYFKAFDGSFAGGFSFATTGLKTFSLFVAQGSSPYQMLRVYDQTGTVVLHAQINWPVDEPEGECGPGQGNYLGNVYHPEGAGVFRMVFEATCSAGLLHNAQFFPAADLALDGTLTGDVYVGGVLVTDGPPTAYPYVPYPLNRITLGVSLAGAPVYGGYAAAGSLWTNVQQSHANPGQFDHWTGRRPAAS